MSNAVDAHRPKPNRMAAPATLAQGTYDILQNRLRTQADALRERLNALDTDRRETFGAIETQLLATERITTDNNCVAMDLVPVGEQFLFGYNVHLGLRQQMRVSDAFSVYRYADRSFHQLPAPDGVPALLADEAFLRDFQNLYQYYRDTRFVKFVRIGPHLYLVFETGKRDGNLKAFKWLVREGGLTYVDNRSEHELVYPEQHEFRWERPRREDQRGGMHPHIAIADRLFVETTGGDLTVKVEDNTDTGEGLYAEPVDDPDQRLDDAEIHYALIGHLIALKIRPFREKAFRYLIYNEKTRRVQRVDALESAAVLLPDGHGLIFANGYYLQTGEFKQFEEGLFEAMRNAAQRFELRRAAPNGEDFLYVFYSPAARTYALLAYNLIRQEVAPPVVCHGYSIFQNGELCFFRHDEEPRRNHVVQIWQTPFVAPDFETPAVGDSALRKIGNRDVVRALADAHELLGLIGRETPYEDLYVDLVRRATALLDAHPWLSLPVARQLNEPLGAIRQTAEAAIDAYEQVARVRRETQEVSAGAFGRVAEALRRATRARFDTVDAYVKLLADLRRLRGEVVSLKDLRYADADAIAEREAALADATERLAAACADFLLRDDALAPYEAAHQRLTEQAEAVGKVTDADQVEERLNADAADLEVLIDVVSNLKIADATQTTQIIDRISALYARFNQVRARLRRRRQELFSAEGQAEFDAQLKLIDQSVTNYLDLSDTPEKTDAYLNKLIVQLEALEARFADFEAFLPGLAEKRATLYDAFESHKLRLIEARNRRTTALVQSAERLLSSVRNRLGQFQAAADLNAYLAADLMVDKVRDLIDQLRQTGDTVRADDVQGRLNTLRETALRQLKDKQELYADDGSAIRFGDHLFSVSEQSLDLSVVLRDDVLHFHLTGTDFFQPIEDEGLAETRPVWEQTLVSESAAVYRAEYLAYQMFRDPASTQWVGLTPEALRARVRTFMTPRYGEGYVKGVHDHDAARLLAVLLRLRQELGLLRFTPTARACARLWWEAFAPADARNGLYDRLRGAAAVRGAFPAAAGFDALRADVRAALRAFCEATGLFDAAVGDAAGTYLFAVFSDPEADGTPAHPIGHGAAALYERFTKHLRAQRAQQAFERSVAPLAEQPAARFALVKQWLRAFDNDAPAAVLTEAATLLFLDDWQPERVVKVALEETIGEMQGTHPVLDAGRYHLRYHAFVEKLTRYEQEEVALFRRFTLRKKALTQAFREQLRLDTFRPRVLAGFVRNQLIDEVYLPRFGANLAKQLGTAGADQHLDRMGLLLLISPPGYGKTTLIEYVADRLGLIFVKINGPAIGHGVTSLDPAEAPNAAARAELERLNLALEMGDNLMLYLDDIQHLHPEFLQKFIPLCDAQRQIEGVYGGQSRTYDLRGKKVGVVMAGNPYTESGALFRVPDMLANRADIYNLGDMAGQAADAFALSYLENSATANPTLSRLATQSQRDLLAVLRWAATGRREGLTFEAEHPPEALDAYVAVAQRLLQVRDVVMRVNQAYIASAAQADAYRTEPPFRLQGSYRDMNKLAAQVSPLLDEGELDALLQSHYAREAQTLTTGAEANLLKYKSLVGQLTAEEEARWADICRTFVRQHQTANGAAVAHHMEAIAAGLRAIGERLGAQSP